MVRMLTYIVQQDNSPETTAEGVECPIRCLAIVSLVLPISLQDVAERSGTRRNGKVRP